MGRYESLKIFSGNAHPRLAAAIASGLGLPIGRIEVTRFRNGEIRVIVEENVRGDDIFLVQPTSTPVNENLMELLIMIDAMRRASAGRITAIIPFYGYARQDRKTRGREPITAKLVANLLTTAGVDRVVTMDLHAGQIQGFFDLPVDHLSSVPLLADYFQSLGLTDITVVSPDMGGVARARALADRLLVPLAIIDKRRPEPNVAEVMNIIGRVQDRTVIMIDDMIDTGGTIDLGARALLDMGAREVYVCCTHAVFSGEAVPLLTASPVRQVVVTDTIDHSGSGLGDKFKVLSVAGLLGQAILRIHEDRSVSELFS
ncbi:MAG: ribose-phosphate pyrophosphokinase [Bacillota bacterium]